MTRMGRQHALMDRQGGAEAILSVSELQVNFAGEVGTVQAVRGLNFDLLAGESMAIVGESGAGKSATSLAIMGLLPGTARVEGSIKLLGDELLRADDAAMSRIRGRRMAMVFQDPLSAFTPVYTVGDQIIEAIRVHQKTTRAVALSRAVELLDLVGIPEPQRRAEAFPHEFSGGMRQRAMIAMAIANDPDVIVADEPTTALDVTIQAQVLEVLKKAQQETHAALLLITHDLGVVAGIADNVTVMYAGKAVEQGGVEAVFHTPAMPYTLGLLGSIPRPDRGDRQPLASIEGNPPSMAERLPGCAFAPRCPLVSDICRRQSPELQETDSPRHLAACFYSQTIMDDRLNARLLFAGGGVHESSLTEFQGVGNSDKRCDERPDEHLDEHLGEQPDEHTDEHPGEHLDEHLDEHPGERRTTSVSEQFAHNQSGTVLAVSGMTKHYPLLQGTWFRRQVGTVRAVDGIDLDLKQRETLGLVGESGCGKSTTVQSIMELEAPTHGTITILGKDVSQIRHRSERHELRRRLQVVFQDPTSSLDPRMPVFDLIAEPLGVFGIKRHALERRVDELLSLVGLDASQLAHYPRQLSGGQRQRVGIARALALEPDILVLDEPVSALDVSVRASIINLLVALKTRLGLSYLFVAHDLALVRHIADRVAVMYLGKIVEVGHVDRVYQNAVHPYTRSLLSAVPVADPAVERTRQRIMLTGDMPSPAAPPSGCRFHTRCPKKLTLEAGEQHRCVTESPVLKPIHDVSSCALSAGSRASIDSSTNGRSDPDHSSACHFNERQWTCA